MQGIDGVLAELIQTGLSHDRHGRVTMEIRFRRWRRKLLEAQLGAAQQMNILLEIEPQRGFIRARWDVALYGSTHDLFRWARQFRNIVPRL